MLTQAPTHLAAWLCSIVNGCLQSGNLRDWTQRMELGQGLRRTRQAGGTNPPSLSSMRRPCAGKGSKEHYPLCLHNLSERSRREVTEDVEATVTVHSANRCCRKYVPPGEQTILACINDVCEEAVSQPSGQPSSPSWHSQKDK